MKIVTEKIKILLQLEKTATDQLSMIRTEELQWLKIFFYFYFVALGALIYKQDTIQILLTNNKIIWLKMLLFCVTYLFCLQFLHIRWSYYAVRVRLEQLQTLLELYNPKQWQANPPLQASSMITNISNLKSWWTKSKPYANFMTRLIYIIFSNLLVLFFIWLLTTNEMIIDKYWLYSVLGSFTIFLIIMLSDMFHFIKRK